MTLRICFLLMVATLLQKTVYAQNPSIHPEPGNVTWCPGELRDFEVRTDGAQQTGCTYLWTVTNGTIDANEDKKRIVSVRFNDVAGTAVLSVTLTNCTLATNTTVSRTYAINSLKGRSLQNARALAQQGYCGQSTLAVQVDEMSLENTGLGTSIPQKFAEGYEWVLPTGWTSSGLSGTIRVPNISIPVTPSNGCVGGTVKVRAFVNCTSGRKYSEESSISLDRIGFSTSLGKPPSYTGPRCGDTNPVTFAAAALSCATTYRWTATNTLWKDVNGALGPWTTNTPTLTLYPSGTSADDGTIAVDINIGCGTLTQTYRAVYSDPAPPIPVFVTNNTRLLCNEGTGSVSLLPVAGAATYSWYSTGGSILINGNAANAVNPVTTPTPSVTITAPEYNGPGYKVFVNVMANQLNTGCKSSAVVSHELWISKPAPIQNIAQGLVTSSPLYVCNNATYQFNALDPVNMTGITTYHWFTYNNHSITSYNGPGNITANILTGNTVTGTYISVRGQNICGNGPLRDVQLALQPTGCGSNCGFGCSFRMSPNPTNEDAEIEYTGSENIEFTAALYDPSGNVKQIFQSRNKLVRISIDQLNNGVNILKLRSGKKITEKRLVVQK